jgi:calcium-dependent protein kinase
MKASFASCIKGDVWGTYTQQELLGTGMCGAVYKCQHTITGLFFAVKTIRRDMLKPKDTSFVKRHSLETEIEILKTLDHPNVIKLYEVWEDTRAIYLVMELCSGGELYDYINSAKYTERQACAMFHSIAKAIAYCHSRGIAHRDLKLENFLLDKEGPGATVKLIDFGLSAKYANTASFDGGVKRMTSLVGTSYYVAPEVISKLGCVSE